MKSKSLVIRGFVLSILFVACVFNTSAQNPRFYSGCPSIKESGSRICISILVENITNLDAMQLRFKINPKVFKLEELITPSKNPLGIGDCSDITQCDFSYVNDFLSYVYFNSGGVDFLPGDTLITLCGTLGEIGEQFDLIEDMDFVSLGVRDINDPNITRYIPGDDIDFDFCRFTIDPPGNALTIIDGHCDETLGNNNNGIMYLKFVGGTPPYSYTINGDGGYTNSDVGIINEVVLGNLPDELMTVVVTDNAGNMSTKTVAISISEELIFQATVNNPKCARANQNSSSLGSILITPSGGSSLTYTYAWSNNEIGPNISGLIEGTYIVTVSDGNRCRKTDTIVLTSPPEITLSRLDGVLPCLSSTNGYVDIEVGGGTPYISPAAPYKYHRDGLTRDLTSTIANINRLNINSNLYIYDANNCRLTVPLQDNLGNSIFQIDSAYLLIDSLAFICFDDSRPIEIDQRVFSTFGALVPRITKHWKESEPTYVMRDNTGSNLIKQSLNEGNYYFEIKDQSGQCADTLSIIIQKPEQLLTEIDFVQPTCADTSGFIVISPSGGTLPYDYTWSHDSTKVDSILQNAPAGNYTILVTDANGCSPQSLAADLLHAQPLTIDSILIIDTITCGNVGSLQVYTSYPGVTYNWNNGLGNSDILTNETSGNYTVVITTPDGLCADSIAAFLPEKVNFRVFPGFTLDPLCGSNEGSSSGLLQIDTIIGSSQKYTYLWTIAGTNNVVSDSAKAENLAAGSYDLVIEDELGCRYTETFTLTAPAPLEINFDTASIRGVTCNFGNPDGKASVMAAGGSGTGFRYIWSNGERDTAATALPFGTSSVYISDNNNCVSDTITFDIAEAPKPEIFNTVSLPSCDIAKDGSITLDVQKLNPSDTFQIIWILEDGSNRIGTTAQNLGVGTHTYFVNINGNNGCPVTDSVIITDANRFSIGLDPLNTSDNTCRTTGEAQIGLQVVEGVGPARYVIGGDTITGDIITGLQAGIYDIIGVSSAGCLDTVQHELKFNEQVVAEIIPFIAPACLGQKVCIQPINVRGGNGRLYSFSIDFDKPTDITNCIELLPGDYAMQVYDSDGCKYDTSFTIPIPNKFEIDLGDDIEFGLGDEMPGIDVDVVSGGQVSSVEWNDQNNVDCTDPSCTSVRIAQIANFTLEATATSADGCVASDQVTIRVNDKENVFIPSIFRPNGNQNFDSTNDTWQIAVGKGVERVMSVRIFDRWGNKVFEAQGGNDPGDDVVWDGVYNGTPLNPGVYVYEIDVQFLKRADQAAAKRKSFTGSITLVR